MPIIYALVAQQGNVLAEASTPGLTGNFGQVAKMLLGKLGTTPSKLSYIYDQYMFHYVIEEGGWIYLTICDQAYQRMLAFNFLNEIIQYCKKPENAALLAPSNSSTPSDSTPLHFFLSKQMDKYNHVLTDRHHALYSDINNLKDSLVENIDKVLARGELIDLLVDKSEGLNEQSFVFKRNAKKLKQEMWWKNTKLMLGIGGGALFVVYCIIASSCGGVTWPQC